MKKKLRIYKYKGKFYEFGSEESNEMLEEQKGKAITLELYSEASQDQGYLKKKKEISQ